MKLNVNLVIFSILILTMFGCTPIDKMVWRTMKDGTKVLRVVNPSFYHGGGNVECEPAPDVNGNIKCYDIKTGKET